MKAQTQIKISFNFTRFLTNYGIVFFFFLEKQRKIVSDKKLYQDR